MASVTFSGLDPFRLNGITLTKNELGTGSYATVFQLDYFGLKCAGKKIHDLLIKQQAGRGDTYQLTRFAEECRLLSQIRHPNVVQFLGVYYERGMKVPILVMEFLPIDLTSCIEKNGVLRPELSYSILHDVALGLNYLHSQEPPIIHRDLSSNNVLLTSDMKAKISDLGVAKIVNLTPMQVSRMVHNTQAPGTPAYMPPEALVANPKYDRSIDVFSFGIMIIHMFSGKWPEPQIGQIRLEQESDRMIPVSEAERREVFLTAIGDKHPMMSLIRQCIANNSKKRPNVNEIVLQLKVMVAKNFPSFSNRLEMLQHIDERKSNEEELREKLQSQIETLQQELKAATAKKQEMQRIGSYHVQTQHSPPRDTYQYMDQPSGSNHQQNFAAVTTPPENLTVDSRIQIPTRSPTEPFKYGVIRWIGEISAVQGLVAGIEMDDYVEGCTDGTLTSTGQKFFDCMPGTGVYYPLANLQPDVRFMDPASVVGAGDIENYARSEQSMKNVKTTDPVQKPPKKTLPVIEDVKIAGSGSFAYAQPLLARFPEEPAPQSELKPSVTTATTGKTVSPHLFDLQSTYPHGYPFSLPELPSERVIGAQKVHGQRRQPLKKPNPISSVPTSPLQLHQGQSRPSNLPHRGSKEITSPTKGSPQYAPRQGMQSQAKKEPPPAINAASSGDIQPSKNVNKLQRGLEDIHEQAAAVIREVSGDRHQMIKTDVRRPYDPNLVCPICMKKFRVGEIRHHVRTCDGTNNDDSD